MPDDKFRQLLAVMPEIAEAINIFDSEAAQLKALEVLIQAVVTDKGISPPGPSKSTTVLTSSRPPEYGSDQAIIVSSTPRAELESGTAASTSKIRKPRRGATKKSFNIVRNLNFAPEGKQSLADFVSTKKPRTKHEMNLAACYYLKEMMEIEGITVGHVLAVYQACSWSASPQPDTSLRKTASQMGWIDTANGNDMKVAWSGENYIQTKMPSSASQNGDS